MALAGVLGRLRAAERGRPPALRARRAPARRRGSVGGDLGEGSREVVGGDEEEELRPAGGVVGGGWSLGVEQGRQI